jgi:hypothetical protein
VGSRFSAPVQTGPRAHPASCTMGTGSFPGVNNGRGVTLTPHPLLVLWSRKGRAIPLLTLCAVRPVQSLSACTRVHFTFYSISGRDIFRSSAIETSSCIHHSHKKNKKKLRTGNCGGLLLHILIYNVRML